MMRLRVVVSACGALLAGMASMALIGPVPSAGQPQPSATTLRPAADFAGIADARARAVAIFVEAGKVLMHPRCVNCHPRGDTPRQTDAMRLHHPLVVRGKDGHGASGMACDTCHHAANFDPAGVPGHPNWHLAPIEMAWEGKSLGEICQQIKDVNRNSGMTMDKLIQHVSEDTLVGWGWSPGAGRTPAPGSQAQFGALVRAWADAGAHCPVP